MLLRANGWMINFKEEFPFALRRPLLLGPSRSAAPKKIDSLIRERGFRTLPEHGRL
jgi:hypothetical protein